MQRRPLGRTGISVPVLSFGASPLGGVFGDVTQAEADAAVREAIGLGVDLFDTAPFYGLGRSETVLGKALQGIPRDHYLLSTKVGRYGDRDFDFSATRVRSSIDESLSRLGTDHVDLLVCHDIEYGDPAQVVGEALPAMRELVEAGKARAIGVSGYPLDLFDWVLDRFDLDFVLTYCHGTLQDRRLLPLLPGWAERGIGIVNASPLGMGLLGDDGPPEWHPAPAVVRDACAAVREWCRGSGVSIAQAALGWSAGLSGVSTTLVGMSSSETVRANVSALNGATDSDLLALIEAMLAPVRDIGWISGR